MPADLVRPAGGDGGQRDRLAGLDGCGQRCRTPGTCSSRSASTKMSMIPPQVRPTVKASSSDTPYRCSTGPSSFAGIAARDPGRQFVDRALHAPAGDRTDRGAVRTDEHGGAGRARGRGEGADDRADADRLTRIPPAQQVGEYLAHGVTPASGRIEQAAPARSGGAGRAAQMCFLHYDPFARRALSRLLWVDDRCRPWPPSGGHADGRSTCRVDGCSRRPVGVIRRI